MSLATLLDRNKAFAATDAVAKNPQVPWLPSQLSYVITCIDSRTEPASASSASTSVKRQCSERSAAGSPRPCCATSPTSAT